MQFFRPTTLSDKAVLEPRVSPAFAITYFYSYCNISPTPMKTCQSVWIQWPFFFKTLNQRSLTSRWPLTPSLLRSQIVKIFKNFQLYSLNLPPKLQFISSKIFKNFSSLDLTFAKKNQFFRPPFRRSGPDIPTPKKVECPPPPSPWNTPPTHTRQVHVIMSVEFFYLCSNLIILKYPLPSAQILIWKILFWCCHNLIFTQELVSDTHWHQPQNKLN